MKFDTGMRALGELKQVVRFALTAGLATAVHLTIAEALTLARIAPSSFVANAVAFGPAVIVSYLAQRRVTFRSQGSAARFLALALAGFALNNVVLLGVTHQGVPAALELLLSGVASPALSYIGSRQLVFAQKKRLAECSEPLSQSKSKDKPTEAGLRRMLTLRG
jgi:putative flippase GtrA